MYFTQINFQRLIEIATSEDQRIRQIWIKNPYASEGHERQYQPITLVSVNLSMDVGDHTEVIIHYLENGRHHEQVVLSKGIYVAGTNTKISNWHGQLRYFDTPTQQTFFEGHRATDSGNQEICRELVRREIIMNANSFIDLFQEANQDDFYELITVECCECGEHETTGDGIGNPGQVWEEYQSFEEYNTNEGEELTEEEFAELVETLEAEEGYTPGRWETCEHCQGEVNYIPEIYEYWFVNDSFGRKLSEKGQVVFDAEGYTVWGRQCTGQAILLDYVIGQIAEEMEILSGQKYSWANEN